MRETPDRSALVTLVAVRSDSEANIIRAVLAGEGIEAFIPGQIASGMLPHLTNALNPNGVEVLVPTEQLDQAREVLESTHRPPPQEELRTPEANQPPSPCELYAKKALATAGYSWLLVPFLLLAAYYAVRALCAPVTDDPVSMARRQLFWAAVIALPNLLLWAVILWQIMRPDYFPPDGIPIEIPYPPQGP